MIGLPLSFVTAGAFEWWAHKHVLHGKGRDKKSFWAFHFHEHHSASRRNDMIDADYHRSPLHWNAQGKEILALAALAVPIVAVAPLVPFWSAGSLYHLQKYYRVHKRAHLDPEWAREHLPWHYDHHMAPDQDQNWGVTRPWMDELMGTRLVYAGTPKEAEDRARRAKARAARAAKEAAESAPKAAQAEPVRAAS